MSRRLLHELAPGLDGFVSPVDLVQRPTPVIEEAALAARWGQAELWVKRDDLTNPLYGGSKVRNLEFFLGRARKLGVEAVATMGPYGSHQVLATAVFGRQQGFLTRGLLTPQAAVREIDLNARLLPAFGMEGSAARTSPRSPGTWRRLGWAGWGEAALTGFPPAPTIRWA
jgi:D-cysteine desulfhydrase